MASSRDPRLLHVVGNSRRDGLKEVIARVAAEHAMQLEICAALDKLAGHLPLTHDLELVGLVARVLEPSFVEHVDMQERLVFPLLKRRYAAFKIVCKDLARFVDEHARHFDTTRAASVMLGELARGAAVDGPALQSALRKVCLERRRHVRAERALIDQLMPKAVSPIERVRLEAMMWGSAWPRLEAGPRRLR